MNDLLNMAGVKTPINILPEQGIAEYFGHIMLHEEAESLYSTLYNKIEWKHDEAIIFGKKIVTKRQVAWYGDKEFTYTYSNVSKKAMLWTKDLRRLKSLVEEKCNAEFNSCLLNLYADGAAGMGWHSDAERDLVKNGTIASVSLGAERIFRFKNKASKQLVSINLEHGSLLVMRANTQSNWLHCLPKSVRVTTPRINLTFRQIRD